MGLVNFKSSDVHFVVWDIGFAVVANSLLHVPEYTKLSHSPRALSPFFHPELSLSSLSYTFTGIGTLR